MFTGAGLFIGRQNFLFSHFLCNQFIVSKVFTISSKMGRILCGLVLLVLVHCSLGRKDPNEMCIGVPNRSFLKDFRRCENYFVCVNGVSHSDACPDPFFFNEAKQACDHQRNVECKNCPSDKEMTMTNPESKTCDSFVRCRNGERELVRCPVGFIYDEFRGRCNLVTMAECGAELCTTDMNPSRFVFVPSKFDCRRYFICHQGNAMARECPTGLKFNPAINGCDFDTNVICTPSGPVPIPNPLPEIISVDCPVTGMAFRPHPTNCRQAFLCVNGDAQLISCSEGLAWDRDQNVCVPMHQTSCV
uniref:Chitin-binding type-2 domain-containing protein n=1 Tax=Phlebotomus papatasi TaxID=29031 RepID=A0A1B0DLW6_PHLPP